MRSAGEPTGPAGHLCRDRGRHPGSWLLAGSATDRWFGAGDGRSIPFGYDEVGAAHDTAPAPGAPWIYHYDRSSNTLRVSSAMEVGYPAPRGGGSVVRPVPGGTAGSRPCAISANRAQAATSLAVLSVPRQSTSDSLVAPGRTGLCRAVGSSCSGPTAPSSVCDYSREVDLPRSTYGRPGRVRYFHLKFRG